MCMYMYVIYLVCIYAYMINLYTYLGGLADAPGGTGRPPDNTHSPPTKSFPTKSPRVELSGRPPIKSYGHENSHSLELRVCLSQTL